MWFRPAAIATVALGIAGCSGSSGPAPAIIASSGTPLSNFEWVTGLLATGCVDPGRDAG